VHNLTSVYAGKAAYYQANREIPHNLNIRHIWFDMADTHKLILDISLVYLTRG
jgi:hypothetical protein